jgi:hypothetical protein
LVLLIKLGSVVKTFVSIGISAGHPFSTCGALTLCLYDNVLSIYLLAGLLCSYYSINIIPSCISLPLLKGSNCSILSILLFYSGYSTWSSSSKFYTPCSVFILGFYLGIFWFLSAVCIKHVWGMSIVKCIILRIKAC